MDLQAKRNGLQRMRQLKTVLNILRVPCCCAAKNIIEAVLENDSYFEDSGNYPENSFGSIADTLIRICFPATPLDSIRNLYREDRNKFSTKILGTFETYYE